MSKPPIKYPLPARPSQITTQLAQNVVAAPRQVAPLSFPRPPATYESPPPPPPAASPISNLAHSPYQQPNSPKVFTNVLMEEGDWLRERLNAQELQSTSQRIHWGEGWQVQWRKWSSSTLFAAPVVVAVATTIPTPLPLPSTSTSTTVPARPRAVRVTGTGKRPRNILDGDEEFDEEMAATLKPSQASTSTHPLSSVSSLPIPHYPSISKLWPQLGQMDNDAVTSDPIECAKRRINALTSTSGHTTSMMENLFCYVDTAGSADDAKGKGKGKQTAISRDFWVFAIVTKAEANEMEIGDTVSLTAQLGSLEFDGLIASTSGTISHASLFPALYDSTNQSPLALSSLPLTSLPSALILTSQLSSPIDDTHVAYSAFLRGTASMLVKLLLKQSVPTASPASRINDSIILLPSSSTPFDSSDTRINADAIEMSLRVSLQREGVLLQPIIKEVSLRRFPAGPLLAESPVVLAPSGTLAHFIRIFGATSSSSSSNKQRKDGESRRDLELKRELKKSWSSVLEGTGLAISDDEVWIVCRVDEVTELVEKRRQENETMSDEVVWPASLCLLDGSRPQPERSAQSSPQGVKEVELSGTSPTVPTKSFMTLSFDSDIRRRLAVTALRSSSVEVRYCDPMDQRMEEVMLMKAEIAASREKKEAIAREARVAQETARLAAAEATLARQKLGNNSMVQPYPTSASSTSAAPINMRTPISQTGAPSPADSLFLDRPTHLELEKLQILTAEVYPSPPEATSKSSSKPLATTHSESAFGEFDDWGQEFNRATLPKEFDDGMMMGLTDDDFSFFDDPPPRSVPTIVPPPSAGPSPKFVDHLSYLAPTTPFAAAAASPTSPFASSSPRFHVSPHFIPDALSHNALGLSPGMLIVDFDSALTPSMPAPITTPAGMIIVESSPNRHRGSSDFDAVKFKSIYSVEDDKYDSRRGKFALPTPDADEANEGLAKSLVRIQPLLPATWFTTICDPRIGAAKELKRKRRPLLERKGKKRVSFDLKESKLGERRWLVTEEDVRMIEDDSSDAHSDDDLLEEEARPSASSKPLRSPVDDSPLVINTFGSALLLLRYGQSLISRPSSLIGEGLSENNREVAAVVLADQITQNSTFKDWLHSRSRLSSIAPTTINHSATTLQLVARRLSTLTPSSTAIQLSSLLSPLLRLRHQSCIMEMNVSAIEFWRPMAFEPLSGAKDVVSLVIMEDGNTALIAAAREWLRRVGDAYEVARLGKHTTTSRSSIANGIAAVTEGAMSQKSTKEAFRKICSSVTELQKSTTANVVIHVLFPSSLSVSSTTLLVLSLQQLLRLSPVVINCVPVSIIAESPTSISQPSRLNHLAFFIYDRILTSILRLDPPPPETFSNALVNPATSPPSRRFQTPAFVLSPQRKTAVEFVLQWPPPASEILHRHRFLHAAYSIVAANGILGMEWIVVSVVDENGESWKTSPKLVKIRSEASRERARVETIWGLIDPLISLVDVEWRVVVSKYGIMTRGEIGAWDAFLTSTLATSRRATHVSVTCIETDSPFFLHSDSLTRLRVSAPVDSSTTSAFQGKIPSPSSLQAIKATPKCFDRQSQVYSFSPPEPIAIGSAFDIIAPCTTYIIDIPRNASLSHIAPRPSSSSAISVLGFHLLLTQSTPTSSLTLSAGQHMAQVTQNLVELAALGRERNKGAGSVPVHLEELLAVVSVLHHL